jgi:hypothetical protein
LNTGGTVEAADVVVVHDGGCFELMLVR